MSVVLRNEALPPDTTIVVHLGAGATDNLRGKAIGSYDDYRPLRTDGFGMFALSVYAAFNGRDVAEIVESMPWNQYGITTVGEVRERFSYDGSRPRRVAG